MIDKKTFRKNHVRKGVATWTVDVSLDQIGEGIESMNETACDNAIEEGHLLEDITYKPIGVRKATGEIIIRCKASAQTWLAEAFETEED